MRPFTPCARRIPAKAASVEVEDWDTGEPLRLALDPGKTAVENAEALYKQARGGGSGLCWGAGCALLLLVLLGRGRVCALLCSPAGGCPAPVRRCTPACHPSAPCPDLPLRCAATARRRASSGGRWSRLRRCWRLREASWPTWRRWS